MPSSWNGFINNPCGLSVRSPLLLTRNKNCDNVCLSLEELPVVNPLPLFFGVSLSSQPVHHYFETVDIRSEISSQNYSQDPSNVGEVKVASGGLYEVSFHIGFESVTVCCSTSASLRGRLEHKSLATGVFWPALGSQASCSIQENQGPISTPSLDKTLALRLESGDSLRICFVRWFGTTSANTIDSGECSLLIKKISK